MALVYDRVREEAQAIANACNDVATALTRIQALLTHNSNQAIDWAAGSTPSYITEDAAGNLDGLKFSRQAVANAIGSLDAFHKLLTNQSITGLQGDHLGNLNQLSRP